MNKDGLGAYLSHLEQQGGLRRVKAACNPELEMAEIAQRWYASGAQEALLFENSGTSYPVAMQLYASPQRLLAQMGARSYEEVQARLEGLFAQLTTPPKGLVAKLRILKRLVALGKRFPRLLGRSAPCQEVVDGEVSLQTLPVLKCWPNDGGRFVTLPMVITQDPETGVRNVGMYRMQILDDTTTGMHWHVHKTGAAHYRKYRRRREKMPVAVALGGDPLLAYCASAPLPEGIDEFLFAGLLRGRCVEMVRALTVPLEVPAEADIILEGYIDTAGEEEDLCLEGPFGDHTGFYSAADYYPRFHVTCITHRRDAVYPATLVGVPPMEDSVLAEATERIFGPLIRRTLIPSLAALHLPTAGVAHNLALVKGNVVDVVPDRESLVHAIWGTGQLRFTKYVVRLHPRVDLCNYDEVLAQFTEFSLADCFFSIGAMDVLEHASEAFCRGSKLFIDLSASYVPSQHLAWREGLPELGGNGLWVDGRLLLQVVTHSDVQNPTEGRRLFERVQQATGARPVAIVLCDSTMPHTDPYLLLWLMCANTAPKRDIWCLDEAGCDFLIDARAKRGGDRPWPAVAASRLQTQQLVAARWAEYGLEGSVPPSPSEKFQ